MLSIRKTNKLPNKSKEDSSCLKAGRFWNGRTFHYLQTEYQSKFGEKLPWFLCILLSTYWLFHKSQFLNPLNFATLETGSSLSWSKLIDLLQEGKEKFIAGITLSFIFFIGSPKPQDDSSLSSILSEFEWQLVYGNIFGDSFFSSLPQVRKIIPCLLFPIKHEWKNEFYFSNKMGLIIFSEMIGITLSFILVKL